MPPKKSNKKAGKEKSLFETGFGVKPTEDTKPISLTKWYLPKYIWVINYKKYKGKGRPAKSDYKKKYLKLKMHKSNIQLGRVWTDKKGNWRYKAKLSDVPS